MPRPPTPPPDRKKCRRCAKTRPLTQYHRNRRERDGLSAYCKPCRRKEGKEYRRKVRRAYRESVRAKAAAPTSVPVAAAQVRSSAWIHAAACGGVDPEVFTQPDRRPEAVAACGACPVREACLEHELTANPDASRQSGYRGGATPSQRAAILRTRAHRAAGLAEAS